MRLIIDTPTPKEYKRLYYNLYKRYSRIGKIENLSDEQRGTFFSRFKEKYIDTEFTPSKALSLGDDELKKVYRDLRYLESLSTSTVQGVKMSNAIATPIIQQIKDLPEEAQKEFWRMYRNLYEEFVSEKVTKYKYETWRELYDTMFESELDERGKKTKQLKNVEDIKDLFDDMMAEFRNVSLPTDENISTTLTEENLESIKRLARRYL